MISVCMATRNGAHYLAEQLDSILPQLSPSDEIVITDDNSTDDTRAVIERYCDARIKLLTNTTPTGITASFERSLRASQGRYIFLADQDDVWVPHKVRVMLEHLTIHDLVISDCLVVDRDLKIKSTSFFGLNKSRKGLIKNIFKNSYMGCCMAFTRNVLDRALPFPKDIPIHDFWIGVIGEVYFDVVFISDQLIYHRRHFDNASSSGSKSPSSFPRKVVDRYRIVKNLFFHKAYA